MTVRQRACACMWTLQAAAELCEHPIAEWEVQRLRARHDVHAALAPLSAPHLQARPVTARDILAAAAPKVRSTVRHVWRLQISYRMHPQKHGAVSAVKTLHAHGWPCVLVIVCVHVVSWYAFVGDGSGSRR